MKRLERREGWKRRLPILPALIFTIVVTQIPFLFTLFYSLTDWRLDTPDPRQFIGFENYGSLPDDKFFRDAAWVSVQMTVMAVLLSLIVGTAWRSCSTASSSARVRPHPAHHAVPRDAGRRRLHLEDPDVQLHLRGPQLAPQRAGRHRIHRVRHQVSARLGGGRVRLAVEPVHDADRARRPAGPGPVGARSGSGRRCDLRGESSARSPSPSFAPILELGTLLGAIYLIQVYDHIEVITGGQPDSKNLPFYIAQRSIGGGNRFGLASSYSIIVVIASIIIANIGLRVLSNLLEDDS